MGLFQSTNSDKSAKNNAPSPKERTEIESLLLQLNSNPSKDKREFEITWRTEVDTSKLRESLQKMKDNETFKQFNTYEMVCEKMPLFVLNKKPIDGEDKSKYSWDFQNPRYYDVCASETDINNKIKAELLVHFSTDIADIVLQYCGENALLFSAKSGNSGGMTLTTYTLIIEDALKIYSTYSEKSGRSFRVELNKKYDKKLHMYLAWLVLELEEANGARYRSWRRRIFQMIEFNFRSFMKYDILEEPRPPPRETICIVGDCLVMTQCGKKAAKDICAGDMVQTSNGRVARVICTVTQKIDGIIKICQIGKCFITPEHPIRDVGSNEWMIPNEMIECVEMYVDEINNFVLECGHCVIVDNIECITLGHMFDDPTVKHPVWGTEVICEFLKTFPSYPDVVIDNNLVVEQLVEH